MALTPLKSIRKYCTWCCNDQYKEVLLCPAENCPLWKCRTGRKTQGASSSLKVIRARCLDCTQNFNDVRECNTTDCALHLFRMGHNPNYSSEYRESLSKKIMETRRKEKIPTSEMPGAQVSQHASISTGSTRG